MEENLNFKIMEDNHNLLAPASSELGTAQPQLVYFLTAFSKPFEEDLWLPTGYILQANIIVSQW